MQMDLNEIEIVFDDMIELDVVSIFDENYVSIINLIWDGGDYIVDAQKWTSELLGSERAKLGENLTMS